MSPRRRLHATRLLVVLGVFLSYSSYAVYKLGGPLELYPFAPWRLYSAPVGADEATIHRLYVREAPGAAWQRVPTSATPTYTRKEYAWQLEALIQDLAESGVEGEPYERLVVFARHVAPEAVAARVVAETVYPRDRLRRKAHDDTTAVYDITW